MFEIDSEPKNSICPLAGFLNLSDHCLFLLLFNCFLFLNKLIDGMAKTISLGPKFSHVLN